jgi:hypothetical protein
MAWLRPGAGTATAVLLAASLGSQTVTETPAPAASPGPAERQRSFKSVYGKLEKVDKALLGVVMMSDAGERLAWRFPAAVIAEAAKFQPGNPMIVIYRQLAPNEKRVTALAFPGTASTPIYVNTTGERVVLRSAPAVNDVCGTPEAGPATDMAISRGAVGEAPDACWCCAPHGETCTPGNRTGAGRALLVNCFQ